MKKRCIVAIIVLAIAILIIFLLFFTGKKEICGPAFLGEGRNTSHCDTSCQTDSDCKYICGCGVINKDEVCDTTGAEVDCIAPGEIKCAEGECVELTIRDYNNDSTKYCDNYTYPMTEEQRNSCTCPEGKEKFQGMGGSYCATNSQKPCSSQEECPSGESCISQDGKSWNCTGHITGCHHNMPESPEVVICVD